MTESECVELALQIGLVCDGLGIGVAAFRRQRHGSGGQLGGGDTRLGDDVPVLGIAVARGVAQQHAVGQVVFALRGYAVVIGLSLIAIGRAAEIVVIQIGRESVRERVVQYI